MRLSVPLVLSLAGFVVMIAAACDYIIGFNWFDTPVFVAGLAILAVGRVMTLRALKEPGTGKGE